LWRCASAASRAALAAAARAAAASARAPSARASSFSARASAAAAASAARAALPSAVVLVAGQGLERAPLCLALPGKGAWAKATDRGCSGESIFEDFLFFK